VPLLHLQREQDESRVSVARLTLPHFHVSSQPVDQFPNVAQGNEPILFAAVAPRPPSFSPFLA